MRERQKGVENMNIKTIWDKTELCVDKSSSQNEDSDHKSFFCKLHGLSVQVEQLLM